MRRSVLVGMLAVLKAGQLVVCYKKKADWGVCATQNGVDRNKTRGWRVCRCGLDEFRAAYYLSVFRCAEICEEKCEPIDNECETNRNSFKSVDNECEQTTQKQLSTNR